RLLRGPRLLRGEEKNDPGLAPIFRVHDSPLPESLDRLHGTIDRLIKIHELNEAEWKWRRFQKPKESLAEYLIRLRENAGKNKAALRIIATIERQILLTNRRSQFSGEEGPHYALGVELYSRFSSPMREAAGIFTHKEALEKLHITPSPLTPEQDEALRESVINTANRSKEQQRRLSKEITKLAIDQLLRKDLTLPPEKRPEYSGTILGMKGSCLYVHLDELPVELKVYRQNLEEHLGCKLETGKKETELSSPTNPQIRFRMGDAITIKTVSYDEKRRKWLLLPVGERR
ncbi:MAG: hypothetical protein GY754_19195, partial [bacterium]|nr:hypothetical protein [bacterium]